MHSWMHYHGHLYLMNTILKVIRSKNEEYGMKKFLTIFIFFIISVFISLLIKIINVKLTINETQSCLLIPIVELRKHVDTN